MNFSDLIRCEYYATPEDKYRHFFKSNESASNYLTEMKFYTMIDYFKVNLTTVPLVVPLVSKEYAAKGLKEIHRYNVGYSIGKFECYLILSYNL